MSLPKEDFYNHSNMEDIADAGYAHWNRFCKEIEFVKVLKRKI